jgi:hypothetical protein
MSSAFQSLPPAFKPLAELEIPRPARELRISGLKNKS